MFNGTTQSAFACGDGFTKAAGGPATGIVPAPCLIQPYDLHQRDGYYTAQSLSIQHAFTNNLTLNVAYVGDRGDNLYSLIDENPPTPGNSTKGVTGAAGPCPVAGGLDGTLTEQCRRPYDGQFPFYSQIKLESHADNSYYHALEISLQKRLSHGLQIQPSFTYAHEIEIGSIQDPRNPELSRGSNLNPLDFTLTGTYYLPSIKTPGQMLEGWQINSTVYVLSAAPTTFTDTTDDISGTGELADRWDLIGDPHSFSPLMGSPGLDIPCYGIVGSAFAKAANCETVNTPTAHSVSGSGMPAACLSAAAAIAPSPAGVQEVTSGGAVTQGITGLQQLANYGCYVSGNAVLIPPSQGTFGTEGVGKVYGKPYRNWDFSATKNWKFKERYGLQFRAEFFNILNRTLISGAGGTNSASPSTMGQATATPDRGNPVIGNGPRKIQLGLKLSF